MRRFYMFRSNIRALECYHQYKQLEDFKKYCHDYYLLFPLWMLENNYFDEVIIWRLTAKPRKDIIFNVNGKKYIQRWVTNFRETFKSPSPDISVFRGGFPEYDDVTKTKPEHFGTKIYLGAGRRIFPQWQGKYDVFLIEDDRDFVKNNNCIPFYKTASPQIFKPLNLEYHWDICWPCNFTQKKFKRQNFFIDMISKNPELQKLKIVHCGNKPEVGKQMCKRYGVTNIQFKGLQDRDSLNNILNHSRFGLNLSNRLDGCPRVSTEILMSGTPLIIHENTRLLSDYKKCGVVEVNDRNLVENILWALEHHASLLFELSEAIKNDLSFDFINQKNIELWKKI